MDLPGIVRVLQVVLGISLVIFVHELGHYLAARWCRVRVLTFSLGFGPRLLGWKRGATTYQVAAIPLGGYCRMAGEERRFDGRPPEPDELPAKSVGARFFIYSGGVLMNVLFGLVVFPILFHVGVPFIRPVLGEPEPGSPIWYADLPEGTEVLAVNGNEVFDYLHIPTEVALGPSDEATLTVRDPATGVVRDVRVTPRYHEGLGFYGIGASPGLDRDSEGNVALEVPAGSPAHAAGLRSGDRLVAFEGALPGLGVADQFAILTQDRGPLALRARTAEGERTFRIEPELVEEQASPRVGIAAVRDRVVAVRPGSAAGALGLREDDRLLFAQGRPLLRPGDLERALAEVDGPLALVVERGNARRELAGPPLAGDEAVAFAAGLALVSDVATTRIVVSAGEPAALAGLRDGDRVLEIDGVPTETWEDIVKTVQRAAEDERAATFHVERIVDGQPVFLDVAAAPRSPVVANYGIGFRYDEYVFRTDGFLEALWVGAQCSWRFLEDSWLTLKGIFVTQSVSATNVGGIISIGAVSYSISEAGLAKLFFFLCILSMNLAFLNVLPIPVLDGGHLMFLIVEKIKGSPVSERVLGYSQLVGVVVLLSLIAYVTYNDLVRHVF